MIEEVEINEKFQASDLDRIDLQLKSMLVKSYSKFPQLFAFFSGFVYQNLKCYLLLMSKWRAAIVAKQREPMKKPASVWQLATITGPSWPK